jgi:hypothetical protein
MGSDFENELLFLIFVFKKCLVKKTFLLKDKWCEIRLYDFRRKLNKTKKFNHSRTPLGDS